MKKLTIVFTMFCVLAFAGVAFGEAVGIFGNAEVDITLPGKEGMRLCISGIQYDADGAGDDITFYARGTDRALVRLTADASIGATAMTSDVTAAVSGVGTTAEVILQRGNGEWAEWETLASFTDLAPTVGATDMAFYRGDFMYEVVSFMVFNDIGTDATYLKADKGLFCGPVDSPITAVGSAGVFFEQMHGFYAVGGEGAVGWMEGTADNSVALPGREGKRIVITEIGFDGNATTDDINFYTWTGLQANKSHFTADEAVGQTDLTVITDPGFGASGFVIMERSNGDYAEIQAYSDYTTTALTVTATQNAFKEDDLILEAEVYIEWVNQTASAQIIESDYAILVGPVGMSIGIILDDSSSLIDYVSGYYEDATAHREVFGAGAFDNTASGQTIGSHLALPGRPGKKTCVTEINLNPTAASTDELKFYVAVQPYDSASLTADSAIGDTSLEWVSNQGADNFSDTALVVLQGANYAEIGLLSAASLTAATIAATSSAFYKGDKVYEMVTNAGGYTLTNPVADASSIISNPEGIFCGPLGSPVAVTLDGADSIIHTLSGFAE